MKKIFDREANSKERMRFVEKWAEYVRTHPDKEWSEQQKILIDSQFKSAGQKIKIRVVSNKR